MKFFIFGDCHGFASSLEDALVEAGFDPNNEDHWVIGAGDYLDRGAYPLYTIQYLSSLPRKILVKGNHDDLILDMINRGYPLSHDYSNGTASTVMDLAPNALTWEEACPEALKIVKPFIKTMVDYVELKNHIIVHSFIPVKILDGNESMYHTEGREFKYMSNWRNATKKAWKGARWGNPFNLCEKGLNRTGKTLVFGHFGTEKQWAKEEGRNPYGRNAKFEPYYGNGFIGVDCTTAYSGKVGVVVIEDDFTDE